MKKKTKTIMKTVIIDTMVYCILIFFFYYIKFIDFQTIKALYMPMLGIGIIAIIFEYKLLGQALLAANILALFAEYNILSRQGQDYIKLAKFTGNNIKLLGIIVAFVLQMYINQKKPNRKG